MSEKRDYSWVVLGLFLCSGATALVYEVVWSKFLSQMFGSTVQAQTVVLAVFMGGLALGNRLFGRRADHLRAPVRTYGYVELAIGLYAFGFTPLYQLFDRIFIATGSHLLEQRGLLLALKGLFSVGLLLTPTVLMGGTLPLLAAWLQKSSAEAGQRSARFYSVNSLGAVLGAAMAGFYLVQNLGMVATLQMTALANAVVGGLAILIGERLAQPTPPVPSPAPAADLAADSPETNRNTWRWAVAMVAVTGGVSMGLEVLASRSLSLIFGSSLQAFAIVLMAFILGIGLGSGAIASLPLRRRQAEAVLILLLVTAAAWIGVLIFKIEAWVEFYRFAQAGLARSTMGYRYHQALAGVLAMIVLGVPAALIGSVLPVMIRAVSEQVSTLGEHVGRLLTWNTFGAVVGVLLTGFVLMPSAGLRNAFGILAAALCLAALLTAWRRRWPAALGAAGTVLCLLLALVAFGGEGWRHVMSSGVFRSRETEVDPQVMTVRKQHIKILFYEDAPDATVSVEEGDGIGAPPSRGLRINGKADASNRGDLCTQLLMGHLPLMARPDSKDVFLLGLGSGITAAAVLGHPVDRLVIAENCEPVIRAARFFEPWNRGALTNPAVRLWCEDARTVLKLSPRQYDVIITQPSNPWMAGVGSVFSREYYELGASRLKPDGIMAQWFQMYDMSDGIVELVLRTFGSVFPYVEVWDCGTGDIILLGSKSRWTCTEESLQAVFRRELPRRDLASVGIPSPTALLARQLASQHTGFAIPDDGPIQTDLLPILEYQAPRAFYIGRTATLLSRFDERTWQAELSPPWKTRVLGTLTDEALKAVFGEYRSVNPELVRQLECRFRAGKQANAAWFGEPLAPGVFSPATSALATAEAPPNASEELKQLLQAARLIQADPARRMEGVRAILGVLRSNRAGAGWNLSPYAALAARASLASGELQTARDILDPALQREPLDPQLRYLSRIASRGADTKTLQVTRVE